MVPSPEGDDDILPPETEIVKTRFEIMHFFNHHKHTIVSIVIVSMFSALFEAQGDFYDGSKETGGPKPTQADCNSGCENYTYYSRVCGSDGNFWDNRCQLECSGNTFKTNNYCYCIQNCAYTSESEQINLICGDSGWRIKNLCIMKCDGEKPIKEDVCDCMGRCAKYSKKSKRLICATDGNVYDRRCYLKCLGLKVAKSSSKCMDKWPRRGSLKLLGD